MGFEDSIISAGVGFLAGADRNSANAAIAAQTNQFSAEQAQMNRDWQERMSNTAYQRQVADLQAAGLNPMLAYIKGGGASTPTGSAPSGVSAQYSSPLSDALNARLTSAQAAKTEAEKPKAEAETEEIYQRINNMKTDNQKTEAIIDNIKMEYQNLFKQNLNLTEIGNKMRKEIDLMDSKIANFDALTQNVLVQKQINQLEAKLKSFDVQAATDTGNLGREYNQVKGLLDVFRTLTRK